MKKILIIGATSTIAQHAAKLWASRGAEFFLVGRNEEKLSAVADDLHVRGAKAVTNYKLDVNDFGSHAEMVYTACKVLHEIDICLIAHGSLPNQEKCAVSFETTLEELKTNFLSVVSLLTHLANHFERQRAGTIAVITSVAGDRGRKDNYVYGAAKGAITLFLQGLRNRLHHAGVCVLTVKPGLVDTAMTANFPKGFLWAKPDVVGRSIVNAVERRKDVVYAPWFWRPVMALLRATPEVLFKRLELRGNSEELVHNGTEIG